MTTETVRKPRGIISRTARFVARAPVLRFILKVLNLSADNIEESIYWLVITAIVGSLVVPYASLALFNAPQFLGTQFAAWCIERGSCDFTTNMVSAAVAGFISASVLVYFGLLWLWPKKTYQSIYYTVRDEITDAGQKGIQAKSISDQTGIDIADVHAMIGYLFNDGAIEVVPGSRGTYRNTPE